MRRILKSGFGSAVAHAAIFGGFLLLGPGAEKPPIVIDLTIMAPETMGSDTAKEPASGSPAPAASPVPVAARPQVRLRARRSEKPATPALAPPVNEPAAEASTPIHEEAPPTPAAVASESPSEGAAGLGSKLAAKGTVSGASSGPAGTAQSAGEGHGSAGAQQAYLARHFAYIREAIQRRATYPPLARRMGWVGRVVLAFRILADGTVANVRVTKGAGFSVLDSGAIEAVRRAAPFPPPPAEAEIVVPVAFALE